MLEIKNLFTLIFFFLFIELADAQQQFSLDELKEDFKIAQLALSEAHAGLYRYRSEKELTTAFEKIEAQLNTYMTEQEFYRTINPLIAYIKDGHTKFHKEGHADDHYAFSETGYFPLKLYFNKVGAYVWRSFTGNSKISPGNQIISINGLSISKIKKQLFANIFADGDVESSKYEALNMDFPGYYNEFIGQSDLFKIEAVVKGKKVTYKLASVSRSQIVHNNKISDEPILSFPKKGMALMSIPSFQLPDSTFRNFMEKAFKEIRIKQVSSLIIDLRNNEGGIDNLGIALYAYLTDQPFRYYDRFTVAGPGNYSFAKYAWFPPEIEYLKQFVIKKGKEYQFSKKEGLEFQQPQKNPFLGKLYLLINGKSYSVTSEFCAIVRDNNRAVFVGTETGGTFGGDTSGAFAMVKLPHTKLGLDIPLLGYYMYLKKKSGYAQGILPDVAVSPSIADVISGNDVVLKQAIKLIK